MDTITFPTLVVPDIQFDTEKALTDPVNILLNEDIRDTDVIIDSIIEHLKKQGVDASWLYAVREFSHEDKVKWIFSLPDPDRLLLTDKSFIFPVTVYETLMLKVAETVGGEPLFEKKQIERRIEKCLPVNA
jgi:hypothetical protein